MRVLFGTPTADAQSSGQRQCPNPVWGGADPSVPQIRNILDQIAAQQLFGVFERVYQALQQGGYLKPFQCLGGHLLVILDGTQYFSSQKISCDQCSSRTHGNGRVSYFHSAILPVIVAPTQSQVIALAPEFICPQDGTDKPDCEVAGLSDRNVVSVSFTQASRNSIRSSASW